MEQELSFLRGKVTKLETMVHNINDKIGLVLEKFLNHRASQAKNEEDLCLSLAVQLKTCLISSGETSGGGGNTGNEGQVKTLTLNSSSNNINRPQTPSTSPEVPQVQSTFSNTTQPQPQVQNTPRRFQISTARKSTGQPPIRFRVYSAAKPKPKPSLPRTSLPSLQQQQSTTFSNWRQGQGQPQQQQAAHAQAQRRQETRPTANANNAGNHQQAQRNQQQQLRRKRVPVEQVEDPLGLDSFGPGELAQAVQGLGIPQSTQDGDNNIIILKAESVGGEFHSEMDDTEIYLADTDVLFETSNDSVTEIDPDPDYKPYAKQRASRRPKSLIAGAAAAGTSQTARPRDPSFWRRRFARKEYTITRTFPTEQQARDQLRLERQWRVNSAQFTKTVKKIYYQCAGAPHCPVTMYLRVPKGSETTQELVSIGQHVHNTQPQQPASWSGGGAANA